MPDNENQTEIKVEEVKQEKKIVEPRELSAYAKEYTKQYQMDWEYQHRAIISPLEVDELASKIASVYEQVRKVIDWKEENLLRRGAIERILKRRLVSELYGISILPNLNATEMAEPMILELMRSGYFDNGKIAKKQIKEIENILSKYIRILDNSNLPNSQSKKHVKNKMEFYTWMLEVAACEIEEVLAPAFKENALLNLMTNVIFERNRILPSDKMSDLDRLIQIYIASMRTLYNFDDPIISYNVIKIRYPFWVEETEESIENVMRQVHEVRQQIEEDLNSEEGKHFYKLAGKYDAAYRIIGDVLDRINNTPDVVKEKLANPEELKEMIKEAYFKRKKSLKSRLFRSAIYSTLSIFVAGIASFIIFEGPVAKLAGKEFSILSLFVDLLIPSLVMFILVIVIRPPKDSNLKIVQGEVSKIIHKHSSEDVYEVDFRRKKNKVLNFVFIAISVFCGLAAMRFIFWIFEIGRVPWTSMYLDTVNVAMVFFAAMAIKSKSKEITIEDHVSFTEFLLELFSIPLAKIGQWFSNQWKKYNIFAALFTAVIDLPFSTSIRVIESWRNFLKERSSEMH
ncbi:MAG: hypothetical protein UT13_C0001G0263 [Candidatus Pacebacteria bacterium GW2011_GWF2_38_9]|nr:MAG: hypothetical protein US01_C0001G0268 [candidate division TM6 bacterium GW2011_GWF2_28_16]KKQ07402.1 MAG: hypothetical protein US20_C0039G0013 [Candidatus Pacebacteria bacterium GW2011_GWF1_36_5]KKQ88616.1 MAG: hypothetical protein UT13_C0001G0263 [Candidatus Pacebacteria bacterium GW2011_GWF2_38_9]